MNIKILEIVNQIRINKGDEKLLELNSSDTLRDDLGFDSFDLAELTVHIEVEYDIDIFEDGIVSTVAEIFEKINK